MGLLSRLLRRDDLDVGQLTAAVAAVDGVRGVEPGVRVADPVRLVREEIRMTRLPRCSANTTTNSCSASASPSTPCSVRGGRA